jgi:O-antigen/teichoic acid export membrane protein
LRRPEERVLSGRMTETATGPRESAPRALAGRLGGAISIRILGAGIGLGLQVMLARILGAEEYGFYVYAITCTHLLSLVGRVGTTTAALRFVPLYEGREQWGLLRGFMSRCWQVPLMVSTALAVTTAAVAWLMLPWLGRSLTVALWLACLVTPMETVLEVQSSVLLGFRRVVSSQLPHLVLRPALVMLVFAVAMAASPAPAFATVALGAEVVAVAATMAVAMWLLWRVRPAAMTVAAEFRTVEWGRASLRMWIIAHLQLLISQTDTLLVGAFHGTTVAGIYAASSRLTRVVLFGLDAGNQVVAPAIARLFSQGRMAELQRTVTLAARGVLAFTVPVAVGLIMVGRQALSVFGEAFVEGYSVLVILLAGQVINALTGPVGFLMTMTGHERRAMHVIGATAAMNLALNAVLIPGFGMAGAALATAIAVAARNLALAICVWRVLRIRATVI